MMKIRFKKLTENAVIPTKAHPTDAGFDLYVPEDYVITRGRNIIRLDFAIELPEGYEAQIRPRSGLSVKGFEGFGLYDIKGCFDADVLLGTIDACYRGNVGVIVKSNEADSFVVKAGTRIAQMVINAIPQVEFVESDELTSTDRGEGGYGSTGK